MLREAAVLSEDQTRNCVHEYAIFLLRNLSLCGHLSKIFVLCLESQTSLTELAVEICMSFISNQHRKTAEKISNLGLSL